MEKVAIADVDGFLTTATVMKPITRALGATDVAINYFEVEPGDSFSTALHTHHDQEELFYLLSGTATWDTPDGELTVDAGEVVRFAPGEFQHGYNDGEETVTALAIGAPADSEELVIECPDCGQRSEPTMEMNDDRTAIAVECPNCGGLVAEMT